MLFILFSLPRSGSNRIREIFDSVEGNHGFGAFFSKMTSDRPVRHLAAHNFVRDHATFELLETSIANLAAESGVGAPAGALQNLRKYIGTPDLEFDAPFNEDAFELQDYIFPRKIQWVKCLSAAVQSTPVLFKVHDLQLTQMELSELFQTVDFVAVVLTRNPFDSYVSYLKAKSLKVFSQVDTTHLKIEVSDDDYLNFLHKSFGFYGKLQFLASESSKQIIHLDYQELGTGTIEKSAQSTFGFSDSEIKLKESSAKPQFTKQDLASDRKSKVKNASAFHNWNSIDSDHKQLIRQSGLGR